MTLSPIDCIRSIPGYDPFRDADAYTFNPEWAEPKIQFIETNFFHTEGPNAGKPYLLEKHQRGIAYMIWGWRHNVTGHRRINEIWNYIPRKNSKSTDLAVFMGTEFFTCPLWRQQYYSVASGEKQANIIYKYLASVIKLNKEMQKRVRVYKTPKSIERLKDASIYQPLPANAEVEHGRNVYWVLCDETHTYPSGDLVIAMRTGMAAQPERLLMHATTADYMRQSFCNDQYDYACKVRDGVIRNPNYLPVIFEISSATLQSEPDAWKKEEHWKACNPLYGLNVDPGFLRAECQRAIDEPGYENEFKRLHCNIRTETSERMISTEQWNRNDGDFTPGYFTGKRPVAASLDCSSTSDATSLNITYDRPGGGFDAVWYHWMPREKATEYERKYAKPYSVWEREGWINLTDGDQIHYDRIRDEIVQICSERGITSINVDPLFQSIQLCQQLEEAGLEIVYFKCNMTNMTAPTGEFLRFIGSGQYRHGNNAFMRDQSANVVLSRRGEMMMPDKAKSAGKIDGIVSAIMSMATALQRKANNESAYNSMEQPAFFSLRLERD